ncbi:S1 family peptidase [Curtobacterium flaccumfaciens]|uniref:S1 family peptidase n=1 Tax=Curtobacterium flaccumfaciens TaxID=2035 RepID=UPI001BDF64CC|nr:S1 family peptidase [Curtobacterium flaccumfaciens]MBT1631578.1 trypsin-like serine protease [Curtobacterium flaccumfaciens pv. oortii]MCS5524652.1 S1 family peptidase [Curtobacterium flaccumfaciens pv. oortii]MCX2847022.1 S1 family peptidase [Curtobacterium flaccumfaciens pv. oortii]
MKRPLFRIAVAAMVGAATLAAASPASADIGASEIIAGHKAPPTPWVVQIETAGGRIPAGFVEKCTGVQVNASWVLTARHCTEGITGVNVYQSNSTVAKGPAIHGQRPVPAPSGDLALIPLATPSPLRSYAPLDLGAVARNRGEGTIMGFGLHAHGAVSKHLFMATVALSGARKDLASAIGQHVTGITGSSNHGDSGGPLIVNGRVVGLCSDGDTSHPGSQVHAGSTFALLGPASSWITTTTDATQGS